MSKLWKRAIVVLGLVLALVLTVPILLATLGVDVHWVGWKR
jgi:hypothetical protein